MKHSLLLLPVLVAVGLSCQSEPTGRFEPGEVRHQETSMRDIVGVNVISSDSLRFDFSQIGAARIGGAGRTIVADRKTNQIVVFSADGTLERVLGGNGNGPGEFRSVTGFDVRSDGSIATQLPPGLSPLFLINATEEKIYITDTAVSEPYLVDVYSLKDGVYQYSFPIPHPMCGPRYIDGNTIISGCVDGTVLKSTVLFEL